MHSTWVLYIAIALLATSSFDRLNVDGEERAMRVVKVGSNGQIFMCAHNEANVDARNRDKENSFAYISKTPSALQVTKGRRVTVSEIGDMRDPGFKS